MGGRAWFRCTRGGVEEGGAKRWKTRFHRSCSNETNKRRSKQWGTIRKNQLIDESIIASVPVSSARNPLSGGTMRACASPRRQKHAKLSPAISHNVYGNSLIVSPSETLMNHTSIIQLIQFWVSCRDSHRVTQPTPYPFLSLSPPLFSSHNSLSRLRRNRREPFVEPTVEPFEPPPPEKICDPQVRFLISLKKRTIKHWCLSVSAVYVQRYLETNGANFVSPCFK